MDAKDQQRLEYLIDACQTSTRLRREDRDDIARFLKVLTSRNRIRSDENPGLMDLRKHLSQFAPTFEPDAQYNITSQTLRYVKSLENQLRYVTEKVAARINADLG